MARSTARRIFVASRASVSAGADRAAFALHGKHPRACDLRQLGERARKVRQGVSDRISACTDRAPREAVGCGAGRDEPAQAGRLSSMGKVTGFIELERIEEVAL